MIEVLHPGLLTTVQDLGRHGYQRYGVTVSGAMDPFALRIGNLLVGNDEGEGALEMALVGPRLRFDKTAVIAIAGKGLAPRIDGISVPTWRPVLVESGSILDFETMPVGCRSYLCLAGGFSIPPVLGSMSTYRLAGLGGFEGRALARGDILQCRVVDQTNAISATWLHRLHQKQLFAAAPWYASPHFFPTYQHAPNIRVLDGPQLDEFDLGSVEAFFSMAFEVSSQSDRMGYRLTGPKIKLRTTRDMVSEAVSFGSVQVPQNGNPIVLMADRQTTGGYPKIAQITTVDLPVMAQVRPGEHVYFRRISLHTAHDLLRRQERSIRIFANYMRRLLPKGEAVGAASGHQL